MIMRRLNLIVLGTLCFFIIVFAVTAEAEDTFSARGQVTDANGNSVSGATVTMVNYAYKAIASTKTDANGNFAFDNISTDNRVVKVLVSYTDKDGNTYVVPPEFSMWVSANGMVNINKISTQLTDYPPSGTGARPTLKPVNIQSTKPSAQIPLNENALAIALALGIVVLAGAYVLLRRILQ